MVGIGDGGGGLWCDFFRYEGVGGVGFVAAGGDVQLQPGLP